MLIQQPFSEYLASAALGSHALGTFRQSPYAYYRKHVLRTTRDKDSTAFAIGRAAHCAILEPEEYAKRYQVGGSPVNPTTGKPYLRDSQKFKDWAALQTFECLSETDGELIAEMVSAVDRHHEARSLLVGKCEHVIETTWYNIPVHIRPDCVGDGYFTDLKTCDDLRFFELDARKYEYIHQLAYYKTILERVLKRSFTPHLVAVEKCEPYRVGVWHIGDESLRIATDENEDAMRRLAQCIETGIWPTGYESPRML